MLGVSRPIYVNVDSPNLDFPYINFLGGYQWKNTLYVFWPVKTHHRVPWLDLALLRIKCFVCHSFLKPGMSGIFISVVQCPSAGLFWIVSILSMSTVKPGGMGTFIWILSITFNLVVGQALQLWLPQVLIKPRQQGEGDLLSLVIKSAHPPIPFDTLVLWNVSSNRRGT